MVAGYSTRANTANRINTQVLLCCAGGSKPRRRKQPHAINTIEVIARSSMWLRRYVASDNPSTGMKLTASKANSTAMRKALFKPNAGSSRKVIIAKLTWACQRLII
ncbi:hypothetical protein D3C85_1355820 [compost metagenome]